MTKEMNPAHRIDTLSDALSHYSDQKSAKMGKQGVLPRHFSLSHNREQHCPAHEEGIFDQDNTTGRIGKNLCLYSNTFT